MKVSLLLPEQNMTYYMADINQSIFNIEPWIKHHIPLCTIKWSNEWFSQQQTNENKVSIMFSAIKIVTSITVFI